MMKMCYIEETATKQEGAALAKTTDLTSSMGYIWFESRPSTSNDPSCHSILRVFDLFTNQDKTAADIASALFIKFS
jgi:hypothetical protein